MTFTIHARKDGVMNLNMSLSLAPLIALLAGVFILVMQRMLNYIVAVYLIACHWCPLLSVPGTRDGLEPSSRARFHIVVAPIWSACAP